MQIIPGISSQTLTKHVCSIVGELASVEYKRFPDGELYVRIRDEIEEPTIIQSIVTDSDLICLLQLIDACSEAEKVRVIIPYLGYARQDKVFKRGEAISARAIASHIKAEKVYTINVHSELIKNYFTCEHVDLNAGPVIGEYFSFAKDPIFIAPDEGAADLARSAASVGYDYDVLHKERISPEEVRTVPKRLDVTGRDAILIDDIISTGGTMVEATKILKKSGARNVYVACVHAVFVDDAVTRLFDVGVEQIYSTDTIESIFSKISVSKLIGEVIK